MAPRQGWVNWDAARHAHAARKSGECNLSGTYKDKWKDGDFMVVEHSGNTFTARAQDGSWGPDDGTVEHSRVTLWGLTGTFTDGTLEWSNGGVWVRVAEDHTTPDAGSAPELEDPWLQAAPALDVSGTYSDPWQAGAQTVFKQNGTRLTAEGPEGDWGPEEGTVHGPNIEIFNQKARYEGGRVVWENGNVWEPVEAAVPATAAPASAASTPAPAAGTPAPGAGDGLDATGSWADPWQSNAVTVFTQRGSELTATSPDGSWGPESGTIRGTSIEIFGMTAELSGETLRWDHGGVWNRAPATASTSEAPGASATGGRESGTPAADAWGSDAAHDAAAAWANWGADAAAAPAAEPATDAQREARWREFSSWQTWCKENGILPGKTAEEIEADETQLFAQVEDDRAGIDFDLYDKVTCNITGPKSENIPELTTFEALYEQFADYLPGALVDNVRRCGYKRPTPVQKFSIPAALSGRDIMCCAQTGSGKTAAFLVPILASMIKHGKATGALQTPFEGPCKPDTLVVSPTRELCVQTYGEAMKFCHKTSHRCVRVYGQEPVRNQIEQLARGGDLCISTPGRLWDFVSSGIVDVTEVNCLVLDEADRMLSMNMENFIREVVEKFGMPQKEDRQTLMFSATFPEECQRLACDYLYEHVFIGVGVVGGAVCTVTQTLLQVDPEDKFERLIELLHNWLDNRNESERLIVFSNRKDQAKGLDEKLYERNIDTGALHGDLTQQERETNLARFRNGEIDVLVATDLASRGLDISGVSHVVNFDLPWEADVYVQRIGRTGRIGHRGHATTFIAVDREGTYHDRPEVLQALPNIMLDEATGCHNEVPTWLLERNTAAMADKWVQDEGGQWQERGKTDMRSWGQDNNQSVGGGKWYQ